MATLALLLCIVLFFGLARLAGAGFREAILHALIAAGVLIVISTESLSLFHALTFRGVAGVWIGVAVASSALCAILFIRSRVGPTDDFSKPANRLFTLEPGADRRLVWGSLIGMGVIAILAGIAGFYSAPANWDSMTYHLARVMHWIENASVAHYPCNFHPQLYHGPFAEFAMLHLQLLAGGDRLAFSVQWISMLACAIGASLIARHLGARPVGQALAALFVVTLPAGILQSESTQNSYVLALWLVCVVESILTLRDSNPGERQGPTVWAGCALGLALLTKGTAYPIALPFLAWLGMIAWRRLRGGAIGVGFTIALAAIILNAGYFSRNLRTFGNPLLPANEATYYRVDAISIPLIASNIVRHLAMQCWFPTRGSAAAGQTACNAICRAIGVDTSDPRNTVPGHRFSVGRFQTNEELTGNPLHLLLIAIAVGLLFRRKTSLHPRGAGGMLVLVGLSFLCFCAGVKWMEFNGRLELPLFVLAAAPVGAAFGCLMNPWIHGVLAWALLLLSVPFLFLNPSHCWVGRRSIWRHPREVQYFVNNPRLLAPYQRSLDFIAGHCASGTVGFAATEEWEYPLRPMMKNRTGRWPDIVDVPGTMLPPGARATDPSGLAAVIVTDPGLLRQLLAGWNWAQVKNFGPITVLISPTRAAAVPTGGFRIARCE